MHKYFDAHSTHFSIGLRKLLSAHEKLHHHKLSFLNISEKKVKVDKGASTASTQTRVGKGTAASNEITQEQVSLPQQFDVAFSFAGTEREIVQQLAKIVRAQGYEVFYDEFYPEHLWGKDLPAFFDGIYRKRSRFCVMFISAEYAERIWTNHERKSAQARALEEKGNEYILPVRVDDTDLEGMPPTVGYLSLSEYTIEEIATMLLNKLRA